MEFLDFECEACRAALPMVERLRSEYGERLNVVVRYFPIRSHFNAERAARAVESAAQQGMFEAMYKKMYETQADGASARHPRLHSSGNLPPSSASTWPATMRRTATPRRSSG